MLPEGRLRRVVLTAALDLNLRRVNISPERCVRNLMELGLTAFPDKLSKNEQTEVFNKLSAACKSGDTVKVRELFLAAFL